MACPRGQPPRFGHGIPPHLEDGRRGAGRRLRRGAEGVRRLEAALPGRFAAQSPRNLRIRTQRNAAIRRAGALLHRRVPQSPGQFHALDLCGRSADARTRLLAPLPRHLHLHAGRLAALSLRLLPPRGARRPRGGAHRRGSESPRALRRLGDHLPLGPRRRRRRPRLEPEMELAGGGRQRAADRQGPRRRRPAGRAQRRGAVERRTGPLRHGLRLCGRRARSRTLPRTEPAPRGRGPSDDASRRSFRRDAPSRPRHARLVRRRPALQIRPLPVGPQPRGAVRFAGRSRRDGQPGRRSPLRSRAEPSAPGDVRLGRGASAIRSSCATCGPGPNPGTETENRPDI